MEVHLCFSATALATNFCLQGLPAAFCRGGFPTHTLCPFAKRPLRCVASHQGSKDLINADFVGVKVLQVTDRQVRGPPDSALCKHGVLHLLQWYHRRGAHLSLFNRRAFSLFRRAPGARVQRRRCRVRDAFDGELRAPHHRRVRQGRAAGAPQAAASRRQQPADRAALRGGPREWGEEGEGRGGEGRRQQQQRQQGR